MGFLHKLWDETLAGPTPDSGLGKLRKYNSFSTSRSPSYDHNDNNIPVSRAITVIQTNRNLNVSVGSPSEPSSPAGSTAPSSPFSPTTPGGNFKKFTRRKAMKAGETSELEEIMILNALDRF